MKSKNGGFFGIFKKKSNPAPIIPVAVETTVIDEERRGTMIDDEISNSTTNIQQERKSSIAKTSVLHYSPPGSTIVTVNSSATTSTSGSQKDCNNDEMIRATRKSNIILDDEESVISTPISQYDESEILPPHNRQRKKKRAAPPPPPVSSQPQTPSSPQPPPPLPRHSSKKNEEEQQDVEEMFQNLQKKFDTWHAIRLEEGGSIREEKIKAEVLREHNQLRQILEKQDNGFVPLPVNSAKKQQHLPLKIPQFNVANNKSKLISPSSTSSTVSPRSVDENRNVVSKTGNNEAIARLKKEVEQQRKREKEVSEYRSIKTLTPISKTTAAPAPPPQQKQISPVARTPRIIEYHPMRNTIDNSQSDSSSDSDYSPKPPPIPNTPPPKLAEYRKNVISPPVVEENKGKGIYQRINNNNITNKNNNNNNVKPMVSQGFYVQSTVTKRSDSPVIIRKTVEAPKPQPIKIVNLPAPTMSPPMYRKEPTYRKTNIPAPAPPTEIIYQKINIPRPVTTNPSEYQKIKVTPIKNPIYQKVQLQAEKPTPVVSATSIPYKKPVLKSAHISKPQPQKEEFVISDILRAPKLRKVGMPVERSGISLGKVVDAPVSPSSSQNRPTSIPPPPPPPPTQLPSPPPIQTVPVPQKSMDARDSLMNEIREAGRLRAARASQNA